MMLSIGWGLGYLASKGVEKLLGHHKEEVAEDRDEDIRWRYFGFEELIPEDQSHADVSANITSAISGVVTRLTSFTPEDAVALETICAMNWETCSEDTDEEKDDMDASTNRVSAASGVLTPLPDFTPEDTVDFATVSRCELDLETRPEDADEDQSDMDASANLVSGTSGVLTSLATFTDEDPVALESICGLHLETCPGDADTDVCTSVDVPLDKMDLAVETSCDGQEDAINLEPVSEDPLVEEASSVDGNSEDRVQNYADHFDGMDAADTDVASKEIPSSDTAADNVVAHFEEVSEHSSEKPSSSQILTEDDIEFFKNYYRRLVSSRRSSIRGYLNLENYVPPLERISECSTSEELDSEEGSEHVQIEPQHHESNDVEEVDVSIDEVPSESRNAGHLRSRVSKWLREQGSRLANLLPRRKASK